MEQDYKNELPELFFSRLRWSERSKMWLSTTQILKTSVYIQIRGNEIKKELATKNFNESMY